MSQVSSRNYLSVRTDSTGRYLVAGLNEGTANVKVHQAGYYDLSVSAVIVSNATTVTDIALVPIPPPDKGFLKGTVTDSVSSLPISGAVVYLKPSAATTSNNSPEVQPKEPNYAAITYTDASGRYLFPALTPGQYIATATKAGFDSKAVTVVITGSNSTTIQDFSLVQSAPTKGAIKGKVSDVNTGLPLANTFVFVSIDPSRWYSNLNKLWARTDSTGNYLLREISYGTYTIKALQKGYINGEQPASVIAGDTITLDFALAPVPPPDYGTVIGTVSNASTSLPISHALVYAASVPDISVANNDNVCFTYTDDSGVYSLASVRTGSRTIIANKVGFGSASQSVTVDVNSTSKADFTLVPFGRQTSRISFVIRDADTLKPVSGATVFVPVTQDVLPTSIWDNYWAQSDKNGIVTLSNIPSSTQLAVISKDGYDSQSLSVTPTNGLQTVGVSLNKSGETSINGKKLF